MGYGYRLGFGPYKEHVKDGNHGKYLDFRKMKIGISDNVGASENDMFDVCWASDALSHCVG